MLACVYDDIRMARKPPIKRPDRRLTTVVLTTQRWADLRDHATRRAVELGKTVSVSELICEAVDFWLAMRSNGRGR